jgi:hypothetical protein
VAPGKAIATAAIVTASRNRVIENLDSRTLR